MLDTFHVTKYVRSIPLVKSILNAFVGSLGRVGIRGTRLEEKDVGAGIVGNKVDMF